jgi:hypothetical protein
MMSKLVVVVSLVALASAVAPPTSNSAACPVICKSLPAKDQAVRRANPVTRTRF